MAFHSFCNLSALALSPLRGHLVALSSYEWVTGIRGQTVQEIRGPSEPMIDGIRMASGQALASSTPQQPRTLREGCEQLLDVEHASSSPNHLSAG